MHQGIKSNTFQQVTAFNKLTKALLRKLISNQEVCLVCYPARATEQKASSLTGMDARVGNQNNIATFKVITLHLKCSHEQV